MYENEINITELTISKKYFIILYNNYYEVRLKKKEIMYDKSIKIVFSSRLGDIYLYYNLIHDRWDWQKPIIFKNRFDSILAIGELIFKGVQIDRLPFDCSRIISLVIAKIPNKLI